MQADAPDLGEVAEEAGDLGDPGPLVDGEQGLRRQPAAGQARGLAQRRQRLWIGNTYLDDPGRDSPASLNSTGDM